MTSSLLNQFSKGSKVAADPKIVVPSANKIVDRFSGTKGRSLMYKMKSKGAKTDPCGTPILTVRQSESTLPNLTHCSRSLSTIRKVSKVNPLSRPDSTFSAKLDD